MSYLKLKESRKNLLSQLPREDYIILSQIVDSTCSFKDPVIIRTIKDLQIYFGTSFKDFDYFCELLNKGLTLYLYKPINDSPIMAEGYVDLDLYQNFDGIFYSLSELPEKGKIGGTNMTFKLRVGEDIKYYIFDEDLDSFRECSQPESQVFSGIYSSEVELPKDGKIHNNSFLKFKVLSDYYIFPEYYNTYISIDSLPQNVNYTTYIKELYNRDTLRLLTDSNVYFDSCSPDYSYIEGIADCDYLKTWMENMDEDNKDQFLTSIQSNFKDDTYSIAYTLNFTDTTDITIDDYLILKTVSTTTGNEIQNYVQIYYNPSSDSKPPIGDDVLQGGSAKIRVGVSESSTVEEKISGFISGLSSLKPRLGFQTIKLSDRKYILWGNYGMTKKIDFTSIKNLKIEKNIQVSNDILTLFSETNKCVDFYSKTIGPNDEDIKLKVEELPGPGVQKYRITVSRFDYEEFYEGSVIPSYDEESDSYSCLSSEINNNSKLIECIFHDKSLPSGEWSLVRSEKTNYNAAGFINGLTRLSENTEIMEDFLLIPDISKFLKEGQTSEIDYYKEYDILNDYSEKKNCQILIENTSTKDTSYLGEKLLYVNELPFISEKDVLYKINNGIDYYRGLPNGTYINMGSSRTKEIETVFSEDYSGNWIFNKVEPDNRLVYFYGKIRLGVSERPGYYKFISDLSNGSFEPTTGIRYESPQKNPYEELCTNLEQKKSNYLTYNNFNYYYNRLFSHTGNFKYNTTILVRFIQSHISKKFSRELKEILSYTYKSESISLIESIIEKIYNEKLSNFIKRLSLVSVEFDLINQSIRIELNAYLREILDKDVNLDITLYYSLT